jgi:hypothetical protein
MPDDHDDARVKNPPLLAWQQNIISAAEAGHSAGNPNDPDRLAFWAFVGIFHGARLHDLVGWSIC